MISTGIKEGRPAWIESGDCLSSFDIAFLGKAVESTLLGWSKGNQCVHTCHLIMMFSDAGSVTKEAVTLGR